MTLNIDLPDDQIAALTARALAAGVSAEQYACEVLQRDIQAPKRRHISEVIRERMSALPPEAFEGVPLNGASAVAPIQEGKDNRPIWEVIRDNMKDVPPEDLATLPKDGASQIDHYIYGHPKR